MLLVSVALFDLVMIHQIWWSLWKSFWKNPIDNSFLHSGILSNIYNFIIYVNQPMRFKIIDCEEIYSIDLKWCWSSLDECIFTHSSTGSFSFNRKSLLIVHINTDRKDYSRHGSSKKNTAQMVKNKQPVIEDCFLRWVPLLQIKQNNIFAM